MLLVKVTVPVPSEVEFADGIVGFAVNPQTTPLDVMVPQADVIPEPPEEAVLEVTADAAVVVTAGAVLIPEPAAATLMLVAPPPPMAIFPL